ncbi:MAG TPA: hypothetical protein VMH26_11355 [Burkholderiales bacterium]|nr:hypothetical protein [Burkholderiales bacterium]
MKFIGELLAHHFQRYPRMELVDVYKLLHQAAMGSGHAFDDPADARARLIAEVSKLDEGPDDPVADPISPDGKLARIHLRPYVAAGHSVDLLLDAFVQTARAYPAAPDRLERFCGCLGDLAAAGGISLPRDEVEHYFKAVAGRGYPVVHHSQAYREAYRPAYRVVGLDLLPALHRI